MITASAPDPQLVNTSSSPPGSLEVYTSLLGLARLASLVAGSWWCGEVAFPELLAVSACGSHSIAENSITLAADKAPQPAGLEPGPPALISLRCQQVSANIHTAVFLQPPWYPCWAPGCMVTVTAGH